MFGSIAFAASLIESNQLVSLLGVNSNRLPYLAFVLLIFIPVAFGMKIFDSSSPRGWKEHLNHCFERIGEGGLLSMGAVLIIFTMYGAKISAMGIYIRITIIPMKWYFIAWGLWGIVEIIPLLKRIYIKALAGGLKNQHFQ
jgi:hypothetical protein